MPVHRLRSDVEIMPSVSLGSRPWLRSGLQRPSVAGGQCPKSPRSPGHRSHLVSDPTSSSIVSGSSGRSQSKATATAVPEVSLLYRPPDDSLLAEVFEFPGFPETVEESANVLALARTTRDLRKCHKLAVQLAIKKIVVLLQILKRKDHAQRQAKAVARLLKLQNGLEAATLKLFHAHRDVGLVSSVVRKKGFQVEFAIDHRRIDDNADDSQVGSPAPSDLGVDGD